MEVDGGTDDDFPNSEVIRCAGGSGSSISAFRYTEK